MTILTQAMFSNDTKEYGDIDLGTLICTDVGIIDKNLKKIFRRDLEANI